MEEGIPGPIHLSDLKSEVEQHDHVLCEIGGDIDHERDTRRAYKAKVQRLRFDRSDDRPE